MQAGSDAVPDAATNASTTPTVTDQELQTVSSAGSSSDVPASTAGIITIHDAAQGQIAEASTPVDAVGTGQPSTVTSPAAHAGLARQSTEPSITQQHDVHDSQDIPPSVSNSTRVQQAQEVEAAASHLVPQVLVAESDAKTDKQSNVIASVTTIHITDSQQSAPRNRRDANSAAVSIRQSARPPASPLRVYTATALDKAAIGRSRTLFCVSYVPLAGAMLCVLMVLLQRFEGWFYASVSGFEPPNEYINGTYVTIGEGWRKDIMFDGSISMGYREASIAVTYILNTSQSTTVHGINLAAISDRTGDAGNSVLGSFATVLALLVLVLCGMIIVHLKALWLTTLRWRRKCTVKLCGSHNLVCRHRIRCHVLISFRTAVVICRLTQALLLLIGTLSLVDAVSFLLLGLPSNANDSDQSNHFGDVCATIYFPPSSKWPAIMCFDIHSWLPGLSFYLCTIVVPVLCAVIIWIMQLGWRSLTRFGLLSEPGFREGSCGCARRSKEKSDSDRDGMTGQSVFAQSFTVTRVRGLELEAAERSLQRYYSRADDVDDDGSDSEGDDDDGEASGDNRDLLDDISDEDSDDAGDHGDSKHDEPIDTSMDGAVRAAAGRSEARPVRITVNDVDVSAAVTAVSRSRRTGLGVRMTARAQARAEAEAAEAAAREAARRMYAPAAADVELIEIKHHIGST